LHPDRTLEVQDIDSVAGGHLAELYDVVQYPAFLVLADDGQLIKQWSGPYAPLMDDVLGYLNS
jgi:hypothetical protein